MPQPNLFIPTISTMLFLRTKIPLIQRLKCPYNSVHTHLPPFLFFYSLHNPKKNFGRNLSSSLYILFFSISYNSKEIDNYKMFDTKKLDGSKVCNPKELDNYLLANTLL